MEHPLCTHLFSSFRHLYFHALMMKKNYLSPEAFRIELTSEGMIALSLPVGGGETNEQWTQEKSQDGSDWDEE